MFKVVKAVGAEHTHTDNPQVVCRIPNCIRTECGGSMQNGAWHYGYVNGHWHFQDGACDTEPIV